LQSIIKKDQKNHKTNGWDNIFTLETITNVNNPKKIPFILIWTNQTMWFIIWKNTQWTNKNKKNNQLMYEICQQVDDWIPYDNFSFQSKQLNNEQQIIVNGIYI
jgi:hypothetical protein